MVSRKGSSHQSSASSRFDGPGIFAVPDKGRRATKWRKGSYFNKEFILSPIVRSTCSILGLRNWDSYDKKAGPDGLTHMFDEGIILCNNTSD